VGIIFLIYRWNSCFKIFKFKQWLCNFKP